ncbi:amidase signature domain-containing protein [Dipodascopsis uninucleata]
MATVLETLVAKAIQIRDDSCAKVEPPLPELPDPLPLNVTGLARQLLTKEECDITETDPILLINGLAKGELKSVTVTKAFLRRAALAQKLLNCLTELLWDEALEAAAACDAYLEKYKKPIGPFHGLPFSSKEHFSVKGHRTNASFVAWVNDVSEEDAHVIKLMKKMGGVLFARTTQPQLIMHIETDSVIYGTTCNAYNRNLSSGGSTGGEGALLGFNATPLGMGTDIGGSARGPASFNGRYGLRPTSFRVPMGGLKGPGGGVGSITGSIGPLAQSRATMEYFMKNIIACEPWFTEPAVFPVPWRENALVPGKLKIGILYCDGVVKPHPPIYRAMNMVVDALKKSVPGWDIQLVEWEAKQHDLAWELISTLYYTDGGAAAKELMASVGEEPLPLSKWILTENPNVRMRTIPEVSALHQQRDAYRDMYAKYWNESGKEDGHPVDVILCPAGPTVACEHNTARYWAYNAQWNFIDSPAAVFPVTTVSQDLDLPEKHYVPMNEQDKSYYEMYSPEKFVDAPVNLQLVGRRFCDDVVLQAMKIVEQALGRA